MVNKQTVDEQANRKATTNLTPAQEFLQALWGEHLRHEFDTHNTDDTLATMVEDAYVNHIPVMTGGVGKPALREFYSKYFIPQMPPDLELTPISRTIGTDRLVDEMMAKFTHQTNTGCEKLRVFRPEREATRGTSVPVFFLQLQLAE